MNLFYSDKGNGIEISYHDFIDSLNAAKTLQETYSGKDILGFYRNLILGIVNNIDITILDLDYIDNKNFISVQEIIKTDCKKNIVSEQSLIESILNSDSMITLFTSGTTGQPKSVKHKIKNILREVRIDDRYRSDKWALAFNPTHIAGIQVFFQALCNFNPIYNVFNKSIQYIGNILINECISHISASPTFYRFIVNTNTFPFVRRVSIGGEKSDQILINKVSQTFPNAKITNIYASTEAGTLFASDGEWFSVNHKKKRLVRINNYEIEVNKNLLGITNENLEDWYKTGDIVEFKSDDNTKFKIITRANELINIGGNKVNPNEIESAILTIEGVSAAHVFGKKNSVLGFLLCAKIVCVKELSDLEIRQALKLTYPDYKIPRKIYRVDELELNKNGKLNRSK